MQLSSVLQPCPLRRLCPALSYRGRRGRICRATETDRVSVESAAAAVEAGLAALEQRSDPKSAIALFRQALEMNPDDKEASAAAYNIACCYVEMQEWQKAADQVVSAVNDYRLDIKIPTNDSDLLPLRKRPEWGEALSRVKGGMSTEMKYDLISELRSPFRFFRFYLLGGLSIGAGVGLLFIITNLIKALQRGDSIQEPLQNLAINAVATVVLSVLLYRDYQSREQVKGRVEREEKLSYLEIEKSPGVSIPLSELRGTVRPVIVCGSKSFCRRAIDAARPFFTALKERGVAVIPVNMGDMDASLKALKADFQTASSASGFGEPTEKAPQKTNRWELQPVNTSEWKVGSEAAVEAWLRGGCQEWLTQQKSLSGLTERDFYLQVQLDGSVRASGAGMPPWSSFISDLPPLDDIRTKLTDNIGM